MLLVLNYIPSGHSMQAVTLPLRHFRTPCLIGTVCGAEDGKRFAKGAYCLGKIVYGKGWEELLTLLDFHQRHTHESQADVNHPTIDAYGSGEAFEHVSAHIKP